MPDLDCQNNTAASPVTYLVFRPLALHIKERKLAEEALQMERNSWLGGEGFRSGRQDTGRAEGWG